MTIASWPNIPSLPRYDTFRRVEHHRAPIVSETEDGPPLMRVASQTRIQKYAVQFELNDADYATWFTFVETTLAQATLQFNMPVYAVGSLGASPTTRRCYIDGGTWSDEPYGYNTLVSFTLCVFPT